jgi:ATP-dependent Clp protease ATP-binding subunit ClpC
MADAIGGAVFLILMLGVIFVVVVRVLEWTRKWPRARRSPEQLEPSPATGFSQTEERELQKVRETARALAPEHAWLNPGVLQQDRRFRRAVEDLSQPSLQGKVALSAAKSREPLEAAIGFTALAAREEIPPGQTDWAIRFVRRCSGDLEPFVFQMLAKHAEYPVIGAALNQLDEGVTWDHVARFIVLRRQAGEEVTVETFRRNTARRLAPQIQSFLDSYEEEAGPDFRAAFEEWRETTVDTEFLRGFARVWERPYDSPPALLVGRRRELVELVLDALEQEPRRSVLLVGEPGVGKSALSRAAVERLPSSFLVFEATAAQVHAGAVYVGELETKVSFLVENLKQHRAVWHFPSFQEALYAGQHSRSPQGLLDALMPSIESAELTVLGETTPTGLATLLAERPGLAGAFEVVRVRALEEAESLEVGRHALENSGLGVSADDQTLRESFELAQQFLPTVSAPGNMLRLVDATAAEVAEQKRTTFDTGDVLATIAASSGLPLAMLDPNEPLRLEDVRKFFTSRVLGQSEAVETIVERVAMAKAGLNDPTRPLGVFLFIGPTGTGKTEIAKALAEFMFGSSSRLVRLDMSEFQTPDSLDRLLADTSVESRGANLISSVRKDPFAVVLLDEFEKAAAPVWDLFLQVFDDGRLTDQQGRVADFRRCVIILTSNVGSSISIRRGVGFASEPYPFRAEKVLDELKRSFRPEFLNRLDRVVVFRPFERAAMRALLDKELRDVIERRGLRGRPWAVELDESAYAFLIEKGFTPELGARPLKRAVEQHLLAPLAEAIVEQNVPEGEQFLLVSAPQGRGIAVTFVDPDTPTVGEDGPSALEGRAVDVRTIALAPRADGSASTFLLECLRETTGVIRGADLQAGKRAALEAINAPGFWEQEERFQTLAQAEYLDRLEAALGTAERLGKRLDRSAGRNGEGTSELVGLLANRLYVLDSALTGLKENAPQQVFLRARPAAAGTGEAGGREFTDRLAEMYRQWADRRGMQMHRFDATGDEWLCAVSGLGCGQILMPETGLHVMEIDRERADGAHDTTRISTLVQVAPWPPGPELDRASLAALARSTLDQVPITPAVVRRYRAEPAPLVRDARRGYRTGRIDRVLAGDFDLFF